MDRELKRLQTRHDRHFPNLRQAREYDLGRPRRFSPEWYRLRMKELKWQKQDYYWETKHSRGWHKASTDEEAIRYFKQFKSVRVWSVSQSGEKTLIHKKPA